MLIVLERAYVYEGGGGLSAINMLIVPEAIFSYYFNASYLSVIRRLRDSIPLKRPE